MDTEGRIKGKRFRMILRGYLLCRYLFPWKKMRFTSSRLSVNIEITETRLHRIN